MSDFETIIDTCINTVYCQKCKYYNHDTGVCIFDDDPEYWDISKIKALFAPDTKPRKRGVK